MPSPGAAACMQRANEAEANYNESTGFIAVHPQKGVFLGVDDNEQATFEAIKNLEPHQPIPVFFHQHYVPFQSCADTTILDCNIEKVEVSDRENKTTLAGAVIDYDKNTVKSLRSFQPRQNGRLLSIFNMKLERAMTFDRNKNRRYQQPQAQIG